MTMGRQSIERQIAFQLASDLVAAGFLLSVNDGDETTLKLSRDVPAIIGAMFSTDEDYLIVHHVDAHFNSPHFPDAAPSHGWARFIYGNDGWDVINDYTTNLEPFMGGARAIADDYDHRPGEVAAFPDRPITVTLTGEQWVAFLARTVANAKPAHSVNDYRLNAKGAAVYRRAAELVGDQLRIASQRKV